MLPGDAHSGAKDDGTAQFDEGNHGNDEKRKVFTTKQENIKNPLNDLIHSVSPLKS